MIDTVWPSGAATSRVMRSLALAAAALGLAAGAPGVQAQTADSRLSKIEAEVRALQRKVFPGGDGKFFSPEITPGTTAATGTAPPPASTPVTDMLNRMDAIEAQIARLTGQVEQNGNRIAQIEARLGMGASAVPAAVSTPSASITPTPTPAPTPAPSPAAIATPPAARPAPAPASRVSAVSAIVKPQSDDVGEDEYSYGFRLWEAKFFPEAQQQLKLYVDKYPRHKRMSWGRNLLGRAYLDDGNPREAAKWFLQNYQADKRGDRAPDSLLYLAVSMKQLKDTNRACIALAEFSETYAAEAAGRLASLYAATRNGLSCKT